MMLWQHLHRCSSRHHTRAEERLIAAAVSAMASAVSCAVLQVFFGGVLLCRALGWCADGLLHLISKASSSSTSWASRCSSTKDSRGSAGGGSDAEQQLCSMQDRADAGGDKDVLGKDAAAQPQVPNPDLEQGARSMDLATTVGSAPPPAAVAAARVSGGPLPDAGACDDRLSDAPREDEHERVIVAAVEQLNDNQCGHLLRTSVLVWLALSLHNIPEGLATMVG
jgi:zinc transporter ZupT